LAVEQVEAVIAYCLEQQQAERQLPNL